MAEAPSFQLFAGDYLVDTIEWTAEEVGVYTRLLFAEWANGPLTFDINRLSRVAGIAPKKFKKVFATIQCKFTFDDQKKMYNERLEETRDKQAKYREQQALKGKKRANQRWGNDSHGYDSANQPATNGLQPNHSSSSSLAALDSKEKDLKAALPGIEILEPETGTLEPEEVERNLIMDMALTLVNDTTIEIANQLSQDGFKKSHEWLQRQRNLHMNPRAILHTLRQCRIYHPKNPWGYCDKIMKIENGNFNERDSIRNHT